MTGRTYVLVHGAFHGGWCWEPLLPELAARGIDAVTVDLPLTSLHDDAAAVVAVLDGLEGPVTLLGHSYGGGPITVAGTHPAVERLVYLTAMAPDDGQNATGSDVEIGDEFMSAFRAADNGLPEVDPARAPEIFFPDADPAAAAAFAARLRAGNTGGADLVGRAAWHERPTHYVVCTGDPILLADSQRAIAARIGATVHEIEGDHSPFLARPAELAELLAPIVAG
jgi:pimeloyl-ACP methyl ester carboxylesterase